MTSQSYAGNAANALSDAPIVTRKPEKRYVTLDFIHGHIHSLSCKKDDYSYSSFTWMQWFNEALN